MALPFSGHGMISPRCWQIALSARIVPSSPRVISTGSPAIAGCCQLLDPPDADPGSGEHLLLLEGEELRLRVAAARQHPLLHCHLIEGSHFCKQGFDNGRAEL